MAGGELTEMAPEVPVIEPFAVSVAVMVRLPAVFKVAENVPVPVVSVRIAEAPLLRRCSSVHRP